MEERFLVEPAVDHRCLVGTGYVFTRCCRRLRTLGGGGVYHETRSMKVHFCHALLLFYLQTIDTLLLGTFHDAINTTTVTREVQKHLFPNIQNLLQPSDSLCLCVSTHFSVSSLPPCYPIGPISGSCDNDTDQVTSPSTQNHRSLDPHVVFQASETSQK